MLAVLLLEAIALDQLPDARQEDVHWRHVKVQLERPLLAVRQLDTNQFLLFGIRHGDLSGALGHVGVAERAVELFDCQNPQVTLLGHHHDESQRVRVVEYDLQVNFDEAHRVAVVQQFSAEFFCDLRHCRCSSQAAPR